MSGLPSKSASKLRFKEDLVDGTSEPLTSRQHWTLYYFENHAINCEQCESPHDKAYKQQGFLCREGLEKASKVADLLFKVKRGDTKNVYRVDHATGKPIRIEVPEDYLNIRQLLKAFKKSNYGILDGSFDQTYPVTTRSAGPSTDDHSISPGAAFQDACHEIQENENSVPLVDAPHPSPSGLTKVSGEKDKVASSFLRRMLSKLRFRRQTVQSTEAANQVGKSEE